MKILDFLEPELFLLQVTVANQAALFEKMFEKLYQAEIVKESFLTSIVEREKAYPTGLELNGCGCALPHTNIEQVLRPAVSIATLNPPIEFQAMGDPKRKVLVHVVFMLALNKNKDQLSMLSELAVTLQNKVVMEKILAAKNSNEILAALKSSASV